jgi:hypothetical protein
MSIFSKWFGKREAPEFVAVTSLDQEYSHLGSSPCGCGGYWKVAQHSVGDVPGAPAHIKLDTLEVFCSRCGTQNVFRFRADTSHPDYQRELLQREQREFQEREAKKPAGTVVPQGHQVHLFQVPSGPEPLLEQSAGGIWFAYMGLGSDDPFEDLDGLLRKLEPQLDSAPRTVLLAQSVRQVSELFAPADPELQKLPGAIAWLFPDSSVEAWLESPARLQLLLHRLHDLNVRRPSLYQCVYLAGDSGQGGLLLAGLLKGLGIEVHKPDARQGHFLMEVQRPEGVVLSALMGGLYPVGQHAADFSSRTVNQEKAHAESQGDATRLRLLEQQERDSLAKLLGPSWPLRMRRPLERAPRLCRMLRATVDKGDPDTRRLLDEELLNRPLPLLLLMNPDGRSVIPAEFPGVGRALRAFPDLTSLNLTVRDLQLQRGSYLSVGIMAHELFGWAAKGGLAVALNVFLTPHTPAYVLWGPKEAISMAQRKVP